MEISSDFELSFEEPLPAEPETSELIGRVLLAASASLAAGAFVPVLFKKKRTYTFVPPTGLAAAPEIAPPPLIIEESPQPVPPSARAPSQAAILEGQPAALPPAGITPLILATKGETETATYIFNALADWSFARQGLNAVDLESKGETIKNLHPFAFLMALPKESMKKFLGSYWNSIQIQRTAERLGKSMLRQAKRGNLIPHIPFFANQMGKDESTIRTLIQTQKWPELLRYLFGT